MFCAQICDAQSARRSVLRAAARAGGAAVRACVHGVPDAAVLGVARDSLSLHSPDGRTCIWHYPLTYLRGWHAKDNVLELDFGAYTDDDRFRMHSPDALQISAYLSDYLDFLQVRFCAVVASFVGSLFACE